MLVLDLHSAAHDLEQVGDDLVFEDLGVIRLEAVEDLAPDGHDALVLRVPAELHRPHGGVSLHDVELPAGHVLGAAVHELLHPVGDVHGAGQLLFDVQAGLFRGLPATLVDEHLLADLVCVEGVLDEIDLQLGAEEIGHSLLDEFVVDGLFSLVLVAGLGGEVVGDQHQAVLDVVEADLALRLLVLAQLLEPGVDGGDEGGFHGLLRAAPVLQPGGVVVVLHDGHPVGEAEGDRQLHLVLRLVLPVPALPLGLPKHRLGQGIFPGQFSDIVQDAVVIAEVGGLELPTGLVAEAEGDAGVNHSLALHHVQVVLHGDVDVGKDLQVGLPAEGGARLSAPVSGLFVEPADILPLLKVEGVFGAVPVDGCVEILAGVLGGAGAQAVEAQGILIVVAVPAVLAAGVQLTEHQLPVVALLLFVPVHRTAPAEVLHLDGLVLEPGDDDEIAVALPGLVDGVGHDLKHGMLAALQPVGAEDDAGALADPVGPF